MNSKNALASTLRTPFVPLYTVLPAQALDLSLALFLYISNDKITKLKPMDEDGRRSWETVQTAILSGILVRNRFQPSLILEVVRRDPIRIIWRRVKTASL